MPAETVAHRFQSYVGTRAGAAVPLPARRATARCSRSVSPGPTSGTHRRRCARTPGREPRVRQTLTVVERQIGPSCTTESHARSNPATSGDQAEAGAHGSTLLKQALEARQGAASSQQGRSIGTRRAKSAPLFAGHLIYPCRRNALRTADMIASISIGAAPLDHLVALLAARDR